MGENTKIEWARHTFNPWIGCTKLSAACDFCYAETLAKRHGWVKWGPGEARKRTGEENWKKPLAWDRAAAKAGERHSVFCASLADWADAEAPDVWRFDLFQLVAATPNLDWLLLSKRHALVRGFLLKYAGGLKNIRVGMTVEDNKMAETRLPRLREIARDGWPTFVSYEPALGPVEWEKWFDIGCVGWLIAGGESGPHARPPHPDWFRSARNACAKYSVPFHFKQWGEYGPEQTGKNGADRFSVVCPGGEHLSGAAAVMGDPDGAVVARVGKKRAGAELDGREWREFPT